MKKIVLDVDTGIDDALAILTAALSPEIELLACTTTWGNIDVVQATRNTAAVLRLAGREDVPVAKGAAGPYDGSAPSYSEYVHGEDGQGGKADLGFVPKLSDESAVELLIRLSHEHDDLEIVAVGPLTNLALALDADPGIAERVREVTIMGGAALSPGNVSAAAEANIWHDPEAAEKVFDAPWQVTMVGLDVTMRSLITEAHRQRLAAGGAVGRYCAEILEHYFAFYRDSVGINGAGNHDALALGVAAGLVEAEEAPVVNVTVDTSHGKHRGQTVADLRGMWGGLPQLEGARHRVVLRVAPGFEDRMTDLLASAGVDGGPAAQPTT